ncbi:MAG: DUF4292 domain-containing protein [Pseudomonadota bacterium]
MVEGCASLTPIPQKIEPEAAAVLDLIHQNNAQIQSFRGQGQLRMINKKKSQLFSAAWLGHRPDQFRFELLSPWGQPTATFAANKNRLFFYIYAQNRLYQGDATASNLSRFIHVNIAPDELFKVLSGSIPIVPFRQAQLQSATTGETVLTLIGQWGDIVAKVWVRHGPFKIIRADYFSHGGALTYSILFDNFRYGESVLIPCLITISGKNNSKWILTIKKYAINIPTSQESFKLSAIKTDKIINLD